MQSVFSRDQVHRLSDEAEEEGEKEEEGGIAAASTSSTGSKRAPTDILGQTSVHTSDRLCCVPACSICYPIIEII